MSSDFCFSASCERLPVKKFFSELIEQGVLEIGDGYRAKNDELGGHGLIFLRAGHVRDTHIDFDGVDKFKTIDSSKLRGKLSVLGDVVVTTKGNSTGRVAFVIQGMPEFVYSPHLSFWRSKDESVLCQGFLRAWSRGGEFDSQLQAMCRSTDMAPYLSLTDQKRLQITLPSIEYQRQAAEILDGIEARITLLRETNATLEAIARALFKSWFVDFDPVLAKAEGRQPEGMGATTAGLFPDSFEESELGLVPKGWEVLPLKQLCAFQKGCSYKGEGLAEGEGAYMFNLGCFNEPRVYAFQKVKRYVGDYKPKHQVFPGDLIIANTDMTQQRDILGRPLLVPSGMAPGFISHHVFKVEVGEKLGTQIRNFLFFSFQQSGFRERAVGYATGTTVLALPRDALEEHCVVIPSHSLLMEFSDVVSPLLVTIHENEKRATVLAKLRDTLLPRLISGQLRLPEAEALMAEVAS
ncbi:restriction endonuclease subunit S [Pseudomonas sp. B11D7D]|nr:restriction endonuclease subunit S [Pseudomonas sp. B11D7D]QNH04127.1 restriction endonuclease subunit S [Pseudomonas sp. B11D7D]